MTEKLLVAVSHIIIIMWSEIRLVSQTDKFPLELQKFYNFISSVIAFFYFIIICFVIRLRSFNIYYFMLMFRLIPGVIYGKG